MALTPEIQPILEDNDEEQIMPSTTFRMDLETGRIYNEKTDHLEAIKQFIYTSLRIKRFVHAIYSTDVGSELNELMADESITYALKEMEIPRLIEEALIYDDRIESVSNFEIKRDGDIVNVSFFVDTIFGQLEIEEELGVDV
ncbi:DUF2634 domain-containing protein [Metabacillus fastidiosus]|uniref:DUF2634 domain-containing protein n=1 Tax=Metabacillus fastidiosus TaxID=1458 RepID=UPI003D2C1EAF